VVNVDNLDHFHIVFAAVAEAQLVRVAGILDPQGLFGRGRAAVILLTQHVLDRLVERAHFARREQRLRMKDMKPILVVRRPDLWRHSDGKGDERAHVFPLIPCLVSRR